MSAFAAFTAAAVLLFAAFTIDVTTIGRQWERRSDMLTAVGAFFVALGFLLMVVAP